MTVLQVQGATKRFRAGRGPQATSVLALDDVSVTVDEGEIVAVVGESGAGKSTLAKLILGLERPDQGTVRFEGVDLAGLSSAHLRRARKRMHLVLQDPYQSLHPGMRVDRLVAEPLRLRRAPRRERAAAVEAALEQVSLRPAREFAGRYPHQLSGGQRQRVALARAVVSHPRLVIADEPTSMLDASICAGILQVILDIRDRTGTAFVYITHDLAVARWVSDRMVVMHEGRIVETGPSDDVVRAPRHEYTRVLMAASEGELDHIRTRQDNGGKPP